MMFLSVNPRRRNAASAGRNAANRRPSSRSSAQGFGRLILCGLLSSAGTFGLPGCGGSTLPPTVPVAGNVTFKGQPLTSGTVRFNPTDPQKGRPAEAKIEKDGRFTVSTFRPGDGVLAGEYGISVTSFTDGPKVPDKDKGLGLGDISAIPAKYNDPKTSGLKETFQSGKPRNDLKLDLKE
jgi:hypothetical protein